MSLSARFAVAVAVFAAASTVAAQSLNIDVGIEYPAPSDGFGAAATQPGRWNGVGNGASALVALDGTATGVTVTIASGSDGGFFPPGVTDVERLLGDNILTCTTPEIWSVTLAGLQDGRYDVYLYLPANAAVALGVPKVNGVGGPNLPGGTATLVEGASWFRLPVVVSGGVMALTGDGSAAGTCAGLAGLQLVFLGAAAAPVADVYVDLGAEFGTPAANFAAAAPMAGAWNAGVQGPNTLVDRNGRPNGATLTVDTFDGGSAFAPTTPAAFLLADNIFDCVFDTWSIAFSGLNDGTWTVFLYAPQNPSVSTGGISVGGNAVASLPGGIATLVEGTSWASIAGVTVAGGTLTITGDGVVANSCGGLAGVQLVQTTVDAPALLSVAPASGPVNGGNAVILTGTALLGTTAVTIGGVPATSFTILDGTRVRVVVPPGTVGPADVAVVTATGNATGPGAYTYLGSGPPAPVPVGGAGALALLAALLALVGARACRR